MGKVIRKFGSILGAAVGFVVGGPIGARIGFTLGSIGSSLLARKPKVPKNSASNLDRLRANIDPRTPRKTVVGRTAMAADIRDEEFTNNQEFFHRFIICASHKVNSIYEIWFDDKLAWSASGGVTADFAGYLTVQVRTEGGAANAINISPRMGNTRRYTGMAYVYLRYKLTGNSKKVESPFAQSITSRITIRGEGAFFYDPRRDSTVEGGSGSHRADNQNTWEWNEDACRNPALALLFYLLGWRINGRLAVGRGIPKDRIDLASFAVGANICDEMVPTQNGGTEPRYRCDGIWSEGDSTETVIEMLKATMNADLDDVDGKIRLTVFHNDLASVDADFAEDDILDEFDWSPSVSLEDSFNIVRGLYTDPSNVSLYQMVDYPEVAEASPDGIDRIFTLNLPMVQSPDQAQRLAHARMMRQKFGGIFSASFQATAWKVNKNSVVRLTFSPLGFANKIFRVLEMDIQVDGVVPLILREENAAIYANPTLAPTAPPIASTPHNPILDPIVQSLTTGAIRLVSRTVAFPLSSTETKISIKTFGGVTPTGETVSFPNGLVTGLTGLTTYAVFYDGVNYSAVASPAASDFANAGLYFIGWISTPDSLGNFPPPETPPQGWGGYGGYPNVA